MNTIVSKVGISSKESRDFREWKEQQLMLSKIADKSLLKEQQSTSGKVIRLKSREQRAELFAKKKISSNQRSWQAVDVKERGSMGKQVDGIKVYDYQNKEFYTKYYPTPVNLSIALKDVNVAKIMSHTLTTPEFLIHSNL